MHTTFCHSGGLSRNWMFNGSTCYFFILADTAFLLGTTVLLLGYMDLGQSWRREDYIFVSTTSMIAVAMLLRYKVEVLARWINREDWIRYFECMSDVGDRWHNLAGWFLSGLATRNRDGRKSSVASVQRRKLFQLRYSLRHNKSENLTRYSK